MSTRADGGEAWLTDVPPDEVRRIVDTMYRVHQLISVITELDTLLETVMKQGSEVASAEACSLMLYDADTDELYFRVAQGETGDQEALKRKVRMKLTEGIAGAAARTRESINVSNAQEDPRFYRAADEVTSFATRSLLAVPLLDRDVLVGVIEVLNKRDGGVFSDVDQRIMEMFSSQVATVITNARLIEESIRSERLAAIGQTVAGLSHYTKNIITGMLGSVELVDLGLERDDVTILKKGWRILKRSVERISNVVEDMLAYSKNRTPMYETCDMSELFDELIKSFEGLLVKKSIDVKVDTKGVSGPVKIDTRGMFRCLLNLLTNAGDAVAAEGGRIWIRARTVDEHRLEIEVSDNGPGIPPEVREAIFDPFFSTKGSAGTGLGLAVTQKIIEEHGGRIEVGEAPGGGARFLIVIALGREPN